MSNSMSRAGMYGKGTEETAAEPGVPGDAPQAARPLNFGVSAHNVMQS